MPPIPGAPRNCSKCLYRHPPPTGQNCKLDILNMSLSEKAKLEHNRPTQSPEEDTPEEVAGGSGTPEASEGDSEEEQPVDLDKLTDWVDAQQTQIGDIKKDITDVQGGISSLQETVGDIKETLDRLVKSPSGAPVPLTPLPPGLPSTYPLLGGDRPPDGPLPLSSDDSEVYSDDSSDTKRRKRLRKKRKKIFSLKRHLPEGTTKIARFDQLMGALSRLQSVHLKMTPPTPHCGNIQDHVRYLCDRSAMEINDLGQLVAYDAAMRGRANTYGARAFVYGDRSLISEYLPDHRPSGGGAQDHSAAGGATGGGSGKKKKNKQRSPQSPGSSGPCNRWNFMNCGSGASCSYRHICFNCSSPDHKAPSCPKKQEPASK